MAEAGLGGYVMHARGGLTMPYAGEHGQGKMAWNAEFTWRSILIMWITWIRMWSMEVRT